MSDRLLKSRRGARSIDPPQLYRLIADTIPHLVWSARADGATDFYNARVFEYTGRDLRTLEAWGWQAVVHPDDLERCLERWRHSVKSGEPYEVEYRLQRHDGSYRWHLGAAMPWRDGAGRIKRWFGTCTDIENQKRAARLLEHARRTLESLVAARTQALEESEQRLRTFLDNMPAIAWIKDSQFRYVWISASYSRAHGKSLREIRGCEDFEIWPEELARCFRRGDERVLRANGAVHSVESIPYADGRPARWLVVKFPLPDRTGVPGVAGIRSDITARDGDEPGANAHELDNPLERLSGRERQVLRLIVDGNTSAQVAEQLEISPKSVDTYRSRLMAKLGIEDLPALVKFAIRHGLTTI